MRLAGRDNTYETRNRSVEVGEPANEYWPANNVTDDDLYFNRMFSGPGAIFATYSHTAA